MMPAEGLEPPINGLQIPAVVTAILSNQSLAALATPHSSLMPSQVSHSRSGLVTQAATDAEREEYSRTCSWNSRTVRSRTSGEDFFDVYPVTPSSRGMQPPGKPGRSPSPRA
jgi:hypothetical protein